MASILDAFINGLTQKPASVETEYIMNIQKPKGASGDIVEN
jgi:hypothetical protein